MERLPNLLDEALAMHIVCAANASCMGLTDHCCHALARPGLKAEKLEVT